MRAKTHETYRLPLKSSQTVSVGAGATTTITFTVPEDDLYFIKTVSITKGATSTIEDISIDGVTTGEITTFDTENVFGAIISAWDTVTVRVTNAGAGAENTTVSLTGYFSVQ